MSNSIATAQGRAMLQFAKQSVLIFIVAKRSVEKQQDVFGGAVALE